ncbi:MAG: hypothetical protein ACE5FY_05490, partial [Nitrospiria bacterium]
MISFQYVFSKKHLVFLFLLSAFFSTRYLFAQSPPPVKNKIPEVKMENDFRSDRFLFRGRDIDDLLLILLIYERGRKKDG